MCLWIGNKVNEKRKIEQQLMLNNNGFHTLALADKQYFIDILKRAKNTTGICKKGHELNDLT